MATGTSEKQLVDRLKTVPIFATTSTKQRKQLATLGKVLKWKEGSTPITEGSKGAAFFLILEGSAEVTKGKARVAVVSAGALHLVDLKSPAPLNTMARVPVDTKFIDVVFGKDGQSVICCGANAVMRSFDVAPRM